MSEVSSTARTPTDEPQFFGAPGYRETQVATLQAALRYSQAVRIGDRVETSGQGGWDDDLRFPDALEDEVVRAFDNVESVLAMAGASWRDVVHVNSYHVPESADSIGEGHNRAMVEQFRRRMGERAPVWTQTGVPVLGAPGMRVEIRVTAILTGPAA